MVLFDALEQLGSKKLSLSALGSTPAEIHDRLLQLERSTEPVVIAALQSYCEGHGWPPLTVYEATLAYLRLDWAYDHWRSLRLWDRFLHGPQHPAAPLPTAGPAILDFLLTTSWQEQGFQTILCTLEACGHARAHHGHSHGNS